MAVYGYTRVSTAQQADEGVSLDEQQRMIAGRAISHGWTLTETCVERGVSGGMPFAERPEGARLNALLQKGDIVIATRLDRMFRSALDCLGVVENFRARGVSLWLLDLGGDVSGNGISELILTIMSAVAQWERRLIGERIRDAKRHQRREGKYLGGQLPFGWRPDPGTGVLVENPAQQAALKQMHKLREAGLSFRRIARTIELEHGLTVSKDTVHRLLRPEIWNPAWQLPQDEQP